MRKKLFIIIFLGLVTAVLIFMGAETAFTAIGRYFSPTDSLTKADAIVVVSGSNERLDHALSLYKQGFGPKLIFSGAASEGPTSNAKAWKIAAIKNGVPTDAIITEEKAASTYENALFTKDIILERGFKQIILVSSVYHQRRTYESFKNVLKGHDVVIQNSPAAVPLWRVTNWWQSKSGVQTTMKEGVKLLWLKIGLDQ